MANSNWYLFYLGGSVDVWVQVCAKCSQCVMYWSVSARQNNVFEQLVFDLSRLICCLSESVLHLVLKNSCVFTRCKPTKTTIYIQTSPSIFGERKGGLPYQQSSSSNVKIYEVCYWLLKRVWWAYGPPDVGFKLPSTQLAWPVVMWFRNI